MRPLERKGPAGAGPGSGGQPIRSSAGKARTGTISGKDHTTRPIDVVLSRLDRVRKIKNGWIARCPAHDDRRPSLSISHGDDGRLLVCDFAGCDTADVMAAIGLTLSDLYPERIAPRTPAERRHLREKARQSQLIAAMTLVNREAIVIRIAANDIAAGKTISTEDLERIGKAHDLINNAVRVLS